MCVISHTHRGTKLLQTITAPQLLALSHTHSHTYTHTHHTTTVVMDGDVLFVSLDQMLSYSFVMLGEVAHSSVTPEGFNTTD